MNLNSHRSPCCDSDEQRSTVNNTSNECFRALPMAIIFHDMTTLAKTRYLIMN
ncbi:hypothetical protein [Pseudoalteromonas sp. Ld20]|uniref:hypothetical protein n=1 Tax=Pseudoalteromonas sp. Ld20 TaxID=649165 RepID=UPI00386F1740